MSALAGAHDAAVQMIDTYCPRALAWACITRNRRQSMGRSRGGLSSKIHEHLVQRDAKRVPAMNSGASGD
jgi:hypothetical protein